MLLILSKNLELPWIASCMHEFGYCHRYPWREEDLRKEPSKKEAPQRWGPQFALRVTFQSILEMGLCLSKISFGSKISYLKRPCQEECLMPDLHACALLTWTALGGQMRETLVLQNLHSCGKDIYHLWHKTKLISYIALRNAFWKQLLSEVYIHIPVSTTC